MSESPLKMNLTCYWLIRLHATSPLPDDYDYREYQKSHPGIKQITLQNGMYVKLPFAFLEAVRMEGGGIIGGGLLTFEGDGTWRLTPDEQMPWGKGAYENPLAPFKSIAVDPRMIRLTSRWIIKELVGHPLNPTGEVCAADTGGNIKDSRIDLFSGYKSDGQAFLKGHPNPWPVEMVKIA